MSCPECEYFRSRLLQVTQMAQLQQQREADLIQQMEAEALLQEQRMQPPVN